MKEKLIFVLSIIIVFIFGIVSTIVAYKYIPSNTITNKEIKEVTITEKDTIKSSVDKVIDSVLYIEAISGRTTNSGTGFIYKNDENYSYIITNYHVVEDFENITITTFHNEQIKAQIVGGDEYSDIAVIKTPLIKDANPLNLGDSTKSYIGDTIFTIGSPMGLNYMNSVSKGIISSLDRTITVKQSSGDFLMNVIQVDASINPGNSGGPLCNINGDVIGVTSMKLVDSSVEGMGFAIPIEIVMPTVELLEAGKVVERPSLDATMISVSESWQLYKSGIYLDESIKSGVAILSVIEGGTSNLGGLKKGDVITKIDGKKVSTVAELRYLIYKHKINDKVKITFIREKEEKEIEIVLNKSVIK